jgi:hypothetical protein
MLDICVFENKSLWCEMMILLSITYAILETAEIYSRPLMMQDVHSNPPLTKQIADSQRFHSDQMVYMKWVEHGCDQWYVG